MRADSWVRPEKQLVFSANQALRLTIIPPAFTNDWSYQSLSRGDFMTIALLESNILEGPLQCDAILERKFGDGTERILWRRPLINVLSPVSALVSDTTNGFFVATFDDWYRTGTSSNTLVIYNGTGALLRSIRLAELLPPTVISNLPKTVSSIAWKRKAEFNQAGTHLIIELNTPTRSRLGVSLRTGDISSIPGVAEHGSSSATDGRFVSVAVIHTVDQDRQTAVAKFFGTNGIPCFIEGTVAYDVMVNAGDVPRARELLKRRWPVEKTFFVPWDYMK